MSDRQIGKYRIVEEVGRGGFGTVYRARDRLLDREVALKVLHPQLLIDPSFVARFQQEAKTAAALKHPHIVTIYELGEAEGVWYIAMEFLAGRPLDCLIRDEGSLSPDRALTIARDIGAALDYAHGRGLVHRDVKPSNIVVDAEGRATLTDFGLVRAALLSSLSTTMGLIGTPAYMSPEQCEGEEMDGRSDLYALGVVLYEMLTGKAPFRAETPLPVMRGHTDKAPPPPRDLNPALSTEVEAVLLTALAKKRDERYQSGAALADALDQALQAGKEGAAQAKRLADLSGQAQVAVQAKDWAGVLAACQEIVEIDPRHPSLPALRAQAEDGQRRQAQEAVDRERQARLAGLYEQLLAREHSGDWAGVADSARQLEAEQPSYRDVAQRLAQAGSRLKEEAGRARRESAEREPQADQAVQNQAAGRGTVLPPTATARRRLPGWIWIVGGLLAVSALVVIVLSTNSLRVGPTAEPARATGTPLGIQVAGSSLTAFATDTAKPLAMATAASTSIPTATATATKQPTRTPAPPTRTPTNIATLTPTRTATPKPKTPQAGATQTRPKDSMVMVYVPAGSFLMGSVDANINAVLAACSSCQREWYTDEQPQHSVSLDAYWIDKTEVSNARYKKCVQAGTCRAPTACDWGDPTYGDSSKADHPVVCVNWGDAQAYCQWAGARLPTEAEWEKAARGTKGRIFPWGDTFDGTRLNFCDRNCEFEHKDTGADDGYAQTAPVGSYPAGASLYGALDMAGNVWEWVADWYGESYYANPPDRNPKGPDSGQYRVLRGGSWYHSWEYFRAADRSHFDPTHHSAGIGFRCVVGPGG